MFWEKIFGKKKNWLTNANKLVNLDNVCYVDQENGGVRFYFVNGRDLLLKNTNIDTVRRLLKNGKL